MLQLDGGVARADLPGVRETVPTYRSLLVHYDPIAVGYDEIAGALERLTADSLARPIEFGPDAGAPVVEIPVSYGGADGPDLDEIASRAGLDPGELIRRHLAGQYRVAMLGFAPGFPYLTGMDPTLACPRLAVPRTHVPAGSVAIADGQTGIYPYAMPGGWRLIGRTGVRLFDPERDPPATLLPGARVRFVRADGPARPVADGTDARTRTRGGDGPAAVRVVEPGFLTTVQDAGRLGYQRLGVPPSGAADAAALAEGNLLIGNPPGAAGLEITAGGVVLEFLTPLEFALTGAEAAVTLAGRGMPFGSSLRASPGERLALERPTAGLRTVLCVRGGIDVPSVLGSRSTYLPAGFGGLEGRALRAGDLLRIGSNEVGLGPSHHMPAPGAALRARTGRTVRLPFVPGAQWNDVPEDVQRGLIERRWTVSHESDRIGLRLEGQPLPATGAAQAFVSDGTVTGAIQVTGAGLPIVLLVDRQTTGGYPKLGAVTSAAHHLLGQLRADDEVAFESISVHEAQEEWRRLRSERDRSIR